MFAEESAFKYSEILYLCEPLIYSVLFVSLVATKLRYDKSDTTSIISDRFRGNSVEYY
jgi:hypothetical protein